MGGLVGRCGLCLVVVVVVVWGGGGQVGMQHANMWWQNVLFFSHAISSMHAKRCLNEGVLYTNVLTTHLYSQFISSPINVQLYLAFTTIH